MCNEEPNISRNARLTTADAASLLGISQRTVQHHIAQGRLRASLVERKDSKGNITSSRYRILGRDLISFWNQNI